MSLETLLEAAKFVEHTKKPNDQARGMYAHVSPFEQNSAPYIWTIIRGMF